MKNTDETVTNQEILAAIERLAANVKELSVQAHDNSQSLQDCMVMTSESFDKVDNNLEGVKERLDGVEGEIRLLRGEIQELKQTSYRHELQLDEAHSLAQNTYGEQLNMHRDINELFHRVKAVQRQLPPVPRGKKVQSA